MNENKVGEFFKKNMFILGVVVISIIYILQGYIKIEETGKSILEIVASGAVAFIVGFLICKLLSLQGILKGEEDEKVKKTNKLFGETLEKISPFSHLLDNYCEKKTDIAYERVQRKIISSARIKFEDFKNDNIDESKLEKDQLKKLKKAKRLKITPLSSAALTTDNDREEDPYNLGQTVATFMKRSDAKKLLSKLLTAVIFGYFGVSMILGAGCANLLWSAIQIAIFLVMGMIDYLKHYLFMTGVNRQRTLRKNNELEMFLNDMKKTKNEQKEETLPIKETSQEAINV